MKIASTSIALLFLCTLALTSHHAMALKTSSEVKQAFTLASIDMEATHSEMFGLISKHLPENLEFSSCNSCVTVFGLFELAKAKPIKESLRTNITKLCVTFEDKEVCQGIMMDYFDAFVDNFFSRYLTGQHICVFLKKCVNPNIEVDFAGWKNSILATKPIVSQNKPTKKASSTGEKYRILHLTDLHTDLEYAEGSLADCSQPFCCRPESGDYPSDIFQKAQYWGSFGKCDIPLRTVDALLADVKDKGEVDMIVWTGDNTSHDVWHQTKANQTLPQSEITKLIEKHFPNVPKYPIFGNHECFPADQYDVTNPNQMKWLRDESAQMWSNWLSQKSLLSLSEHGFYAEFNEKMNVKVIALNTQACDLLNFFLIKNVTNPTSEVEFLFEELSLAEQHGQKAIIIGHIPYGDNTCSSLWSMRIQVLIDRFEATIIGNFFGHTHSDHVEIVPSVLETGKSVGTVFIAPSGTTYSYRNPSYRVFTIQDEAIENYYQYRLDIRKVVQDPNVSPKWDLAYDFKSEYKLSDLSNASVYQLAHEGFKNKALLAKYIRNYQSGTSTVNSLVISPKNQIYYTCLAQNSVFADRYKCFGKLALLFGEDTMYSFIEHIQGPWLNKIRD